MANLLPIPAGSRTVDWGVGTFAVDLAPKLCPRNGALVLHRPQAQGRTDKADGYPEGHHTANADPSPARGPFVKLRALFFGNAEKWHDALGLAVAIAEFFFASFGVAHNLSMKAMNSPR